MLLSLCAKERSKALQWQGMVVLGEESQGDAVARQLKIRGLPPLSLVLEL